MEPFTLNRLYEPSTPVASVYLDTSRDTDDPDRAIELRWRQLRAALLSHDADRDTVQAIETTVQAEPDVAGRHGQALFASAGRILRNERLPEPPVRDFARFGALPCVLPLFFQRAPDIPYAAVDLHRIHAPDGTGDGDELEIDHDAGRWPRNRVNSAVMHRRVPLADWTAEAGRILSGLADAVDEAPELIVVGGDPWAANTLLRLTPTRLRDRVVRLRGVRHHRPEAGRAVLEREVALLMAGRLAARDQNRLDAFLGRRGREKHPAEGLADAVALLQRGQAATVLINRPLPPLAPLWVGPAPTDLAPTAADLQAFGVGYCWEEDAGEALVRAAVGTKADLIAVPADLASLAEGLAILPRYRTSALADTDARAARSSGALR